MILIRNISKKYAFLLGEQDVVSCIPYRKSRFCFLATAEDGMTVIGNTFTRELIIPSKEELEILASKNIMPSEQSEELIRKWYLVPVNYNEEQAIEDFRALLLSLEPKEKKLSNVTIMMTGDCNARCFYCYQNGRFGRKDTMTAETAIAVAKYIADNAREGIVFLTWHGGECTLCIEQIDLICEELRRRGITFVSRAYTNGYLFDDALIKHARDNWKLARLQIPLDGTEEVYNRVKAYVYKDDPSPYKRVMRNIRALLDAGIGVSIRTNVDKYNLDDIEDLAKELAEKFGKDKDFYFYAVPLFDNCRHHLPISEGEERAQLAKQVVAFRKRYNKMGLHSIKLFFPDIATQRCGAADPSIAIILPNGSLSCCDHSAGDDIYGNVFEEKRDLELRRSWTKRINGGEKCKGCPAYADCIMLEKCMPHASGCDEANRIHTIEILREMILASYRKWKERQSKT